MSSYREIEKNAQAQWLTLIIPEIWEAEAGRPLEAGSLRPAWLNGETLLLLKIQKLSWAWWQVPMTPATQEAEAGELLEPRRQRLQ